jgi:DNA-binding FadR family transcriptional regulator
MNLRLNMGSEIQNRPSGPLQPLKRRRLSEEITLQLRDAIFSGEYRPGDKLPAESALGELFRVGRPVVREALRSLENSGLIFVRPGSGGGAFVKKIGSRTLSDTLEGIARLDQVSMEELTEARLAVEMATLPLVFENIDPGDLEALERNIEDAQASLEQGIEEPKNLTFHVLLAKASHNRFLFKITEALFRVLVTLIQEYEYSYQRKKRVLDEHRALLDLLKGKQYETLEKALETHIKASVKYLDNPKERKAMKER